MPEPSVTPHLDVAIPATQTVVYCATFQLAWNQLCDAVMHQDKLCLEGDPLMAQALNRRLIQAGELDEQAYLAMAGFVRDGIVEQIKQALKDKFNREPAVDITSNDLSGILAYAYLEKILKFATTFPVFAEPLRFSDGAAVQSFGIYEPNPALAQVEVLDYRHPDDFIIRLRGEEEDSRWWGNIGGATFADDLILAKMPPLPTLLETVEAVAARITPEARKTARNALSKAGQNPYRLLNPKLQPAAETLQIPKISLDLQHSFQELLGRSVCNPGWEDYHISKAVQVIKFNLDETGAVLRSDAAFGATLGTVEEPRQFIFDKPFLVCLKEREARYPYLAVWVGNSMGLVQWTGGI